MATATAERFVDACQLGEHGLGAKYRELRAGMKRYGE
jgi:hypothetical protein